MMLDAKTDEQKLFHYYTAHDNSNKIVGTASTQARSANYLQTIFAGFTSAVFTRTVAEV